MCQNPFKLVPGIKFFAGRRLAPGFCKSILDGPLASRVAWMRIIVYQS